MSLFDINRPGPVTRLAGTHWDSLSMVDVFTDPNVSPGMAYSIKPHQIIIHPTQLLELKVYMYSPTYQVRSTRYERLRYLRRRATLRGEPFRVPKEPEELDAPPGAAAPASELESGRGRGRL